MPGIIESIGVEIEFANVPQREVAKWIDEHQILASIVGDASCENTKLALGDILVPEIQDEYLRRFAKQKHIGGEFVTNIISSERDDNSWFNPLGAALSFLRDSGETPSLSTSIHVHLQCGSQRYGVPLPVLKSLILLWSKIEAAIYRITEGEMGFSRGENHLNYCYYRPLVLRDGPAVVRDNKNVYRPAFELSKLMNAKTTEEFFTSFCRDDQSGGNKYWPTKYHGLNLHSINSKGTVEFRTANLTLEPIYLYTWIRVFQQILALAFSSYVHALNIEERMDLPLSYSGDDFTYIDLINILNLKEDKVNETIEKLWGVTTWPKITGGFQRSHLGIGLGQRMSEVIINYSKVRSSLVPTPIEISKYQIHTADEYANPNVKSDAILHNRVDEHREDFVNQHVEMPFANLRANLRRQR